jgi:hypothetical protein
MCDEALEMSGVVDGSLNVHGVSGLKVAGELVCCDFVTELRLTWIYRPLNCPENGRSKHLLDCVVGGRKGCGAHLWRVDDIMKWV